MATTSYLLIQDQMKCSDCGMCSLLLPKFINKFKGRLIITEANMQNSAIRETLTELINTCPNDAIILEVQRDDDVWPTQFTLRTLRQGILLIN